VPDDVADRLYGLPLDEFTAARDEAARELRRGGDREAADRVRALRKPNVPAWALNQLARRDPDAVEQLIGVGEELRKAQEDVFSGTGGRARLREAAEAERDAVGALARDAAGLLAADGRKPSEQVLERIRDTLHAAAADDGVRERLRAGRLVEHAAPVGLGPAPVGGPSTAERTRRRSEADEARKRHREELAQGRKRVRAAERQAKAAARRAEEARRDAEKAAAELERRRDELARIEEHSG
jgi:hypothetical protein